MKKLLISLCVANYALLTVPARAATCPSNYVESEEYKIVLDTANCPPGYAETTEIKIVDDAAASGSCGSGYTEFPVNGSPPGTMGGYCDPGRGTCDYDAFTCTVS